MMKVEFRQKGNAFWQTYCRVAEVKMSDNLAVLVEAPKGPYQDAETFWGQVTVPMGSVASFRVVGR